MSNYLIYVWPVTVWLVFTPILGALRFLLIFLGFFIVPFAIPFARKQRSKSTKTPDRIILTYNGLFWLWGNDYDGILGDSRGDWQRAWAKSLIGEAKWVPDFVKSYVGKYVWAAIRNPVNNIRFTKLYECDLRKCEHQIVLGDIVVRDEVGKAGKHFVYAYPKGSKMPYTGFYWVHMWTNKQLKCLRMRMGFKIDAHDIGRVGFTTLITPWKTPHK